MRLFELFENLSFDQIFEYKENWEEIKGTYSNTFTVLVSKKPVKMGALTSGVEKYVAKVTHKPTGKIFNGVASTQSGAAENAIEKFFPERPLDPDKFKSFTADLNVDFTGTHSSRYAPYFKFEKDGNDVFLVMAGRKYFETFGRELETLGFRKGYNRLSAKSVNATPIFSFPMGKSLVKSLDLIPNGRYSLTHVQDDQYGNGMFIMKHDSRVAHKGDRYRMEYPGITIAGTLPDDMKEEQLDEKKKKPKPTSPEKWARAKAKARSKFEVYPSAYANAWAAKEYKKMGGGWRMGE
jgi:hypothetical protein